MIIGFRLSTQLLREERLQREIFQRPEKDDIEKFPDTREDTQREREILRKKRNTKKEENQRLRKATLNSFISYPLQRITTLFKNKLVSLTTNKHIF